MPTITNPYVIQALIQAYLSNGMDKCGAMVKTGYKFNYARSSKGMKLFERDDVKAELRRQRLELVKKTGFTKEQAHVQLDEDREFARQNKQAAAAITSSTAKIRLYGMDQIESTKESTVIIINPPKQAKTVESEVIENEV